MSLILTGCIFTDCVKLIWIPGILGMTMAIVFYVFYARFDIFLGQEFKPTIACELLSIETKDLNGEENFGIITVNFVD